MAFAMANDTYSHGAATGHYTSAHHQRPSFILRSPRLRPTELVAFDAAAFGAYTAKLTWQEGVKTVKDRFSLSLLFVFGVALLAFGCLFLWHSKHARATRNIRTLRASVLTALGLPAKGKEQDGKDSKLQRPPVVNIPDHILFSHEGHAAYDAALEKYGDVVIVPRHGRMEYVLDVQHVRDVLTDAKNFSFEKAVTSMMHMEFMLWFKNGTFVQELDRLVQEGITPRLPGVIEKIGPIFAQESATLFARHSSPEHPHEARVNDLYDWVHCTIGRAMVILILGEEYLDEETVACFMKVVSAVAELGGIYANSSWWARHYPRLWSFTTSMRTIFGIIIPHYFCRLIPRVWRNIEKHTNQAADAPSDAYVPFIELLVAKHVNAKSGRISLLNFLWISVVALGVIFASIHQTAVVAVWCVMNLALKPDYISEIREEIEDVLEVDAEGFVKLSADGLRRADKLDSFIRETMRTKGDTFAPLRTATRDVRVGKYVLPKGALVTPYVKRVHEHTSNYGNDGKIFDGRQWVGKERPAVMGSPSFVSFGLGRWACPGRHLAILEIKMIMATLIDQYDISLGGDAYEVVDPMNATSRSPEAVTIIRPRASSSMAR